MGKSNRIRNERASAVLTGVKSPKKKNGLPSWALNLITIAVAAIIFISVALSLLSANGVFTRMQTAMKTENFTVNANMMKYYYQTQYQNFVSQNSSYLSYYGLDTSLSLKDQYVDTSDESQGTWFDYMMKQTEAQVEQILQLCEEAEARGIALDSDELKDIDNEIALYETYASMYGYTTNSYIANMYGKGIKAKDIRNAMKLSTLASKCSEAVGEALKAAITDEEIASEYEDNKLDYDIIDYVYYTFNVKYEDAVIAVLGEDHDDEDAETDENRALILAKYEELIEEARASAEALAEKTDVAAFKADIYARLSEKAYDDAYETAMKDSDLTSDKLPDEGTLVLLRLKAVEYIASILESGDAYEAVTEIDGDTATAFGITLTADFAEELEAVMATAASDAVADAEACVSEKTSYTEDDELSEWLFDEGRKAGDTKTLESGDGADGAELPEDTDELESSFSVSAYYVTKAQYKNEALSKNVGIMVFSSEDTAKTAIEKLSEGITLDEFEAICTELGGSFTDYEDYIKGAMGVTAFDTWLYGDDVSAGDYTSSVITLSSDSSYAVALYYGDGAPEWYVTVKNAIYSDDYEAFSSDIAEKYTVTVKEKVINRIDG